MRRLIFRAMKFEKMTQNQKGLDNMMLQIIQGKNPLALPPAEEEAHEPPNRIGKTSKRKE